MFTKISEPNDGMSDWKVFIRKEELQTMTGSEALRLAEKCWTDARTTHLVIDNALAEVFAEEILRTSALLDTLTVENSNLLEQLSKV